MLGLLTVTAAVLLVPAFAALLAVERHRHVAPGEDRRRWVRVVVAATVVALASLGIAALLTADAVSAGVVAIVLAGSVLVWGPLSSSWAVRGVVMWALLVSAALGLLGWLVQQMVGGSISGVEVTFTVGASLLLLVALWRGQGVARDYIGAQAGLGPRSVVRQHLPLLRPLAGLAVLLAAGGSVLAVTSDHTGRIEQGAPRAGGTGPASPLPQPSTASTPTVSRSPSTAGVPLPPRADAPAGPGRGDRPAEAVLRPSLALGESVRTLSATGAPSAAHPSHAATPTRVVGPHLVTTPRRGGSPRDGRNSDRQQPSGGSTALPEPTPVTRTTPPVASTPPTPEPVRPLRTPGYAKPKPNRPWGAPSPGHGRLHHHVEPPLPPRSLVPGQVPALTVPATP